MKKISNIIISFVIVFALISGILFCTALSPDASNDEALLFNSTGSNNNEFLLDKYIINQPSENNELISITSEDTTAMIRNTTMRKYCNDILESPDKYETKTVLDAIIYYLANNTITTEKYDELINIYISVYKKIKEEYTKKVFPQEKYLHIHYEIIMSLLDEQYISLDYIDEDHSSYNIKYLYDKTDNDNITYNQISKMYYFALKLDKDYTPLSIIISDYIKIGLRRNYNSTTLIVNKLNDNPSLSEVTTIFNMYNWIFNDELFSNYERNYTKQEYEDMYNISDFSIYLKAFLKNYKNADKVIIEDKNIPLKDNLPLPDTIKKCPDYAIELRDIDGDNKKEILYSYILSTNNDIETISPINNKKEKIYGIVAFKYDSNTNSYTKTALVNNQYQIELSNKEICNNYSDYLIDALKYSNLLIFHTYADK